MTTERIIAAGLAMADASGIEAVSMRRVGQQLGVEAMSLYNHVRNKDDLLDGLVEAVADELPVPEIGAPWTSTIRRCAMEARLVLCRHPWAIDVMSFRGSVGPVRMRYANAVLDTFREGGFEVQLAHYALHVYVGHVFGFNRQELRTRADADLGPEFARVLQGDLARQYPYIAESVEHSRHDDEAEYAIVLDLLLDGLERLRQAQAAP